MSNQAMHPEPINASSPPSPKPSNGSRAAIALACWLLSSIGALTSLMMIVGVSVVAVLTEPISDVIQSSSFYLGIGTAYSWTALAVMTEGWVSNKFVSWHWPLFGGIVGIVCAVYFAAFILICLPCVFLGMYLCYFHLAGHTPDEQNAT
ncbi:hypothetical protein [Acidovorax sp.]|uniref:hypothetical protein n=1 Tax=Acidovorax sp. TaxID=1872122 RepID=UPI0025C7181C|nr:hypothetical protein [Acidovorax sp.]